MACSQRPVLTRMGAWDRQWPRACMRACMGGGEHGSCILKWGMCGAKRIKTDTYISRASAHAFVYNKHGSTLIIGDRRSANGHMQTMYAFARETHQG